MVPPLESGSGAGIFDQRRGAVKGIWLLALRKRDAHAKRRFRFKARAESRDAGQGLAPEDQIARVNRWRSKH
jgi:hypothetical protein